jgi:transcriptional antiterminator RfaH
VRVRTIRILGAPATMNRWYAALCKPRQEEIAEVNLAFQGFTVYLPRYKSKCRRAGRWVDRIEPLFPRYVFVGASVELQSVAPIRSTRGVCGLVRFGGQLATVPDTLIDALREREDPASGMHGSRRPLFEPGDRIKLAQGPLAGLEGLFSSESADERVFVLMDLLGRQNKLEVNRDWVVAAK